MSRVPRLEVSSLLCKLNLLIYLSMTNPMQKYSFLRNSAKISMEFLKNLKKTPEFIFIARLPQCDSPTTQPCRDTSHVSASHRMCPRRTHAVRPYNKKTTPARMVFIVWPVETVHAPSLQIIYRIIPPNQRNTTWVRAREQDAQGARRSGSSCSSCSSRPNRSRSTSRCAGRPCQAN